MRIGNEDRDKHAIRGPAGLPGFEQIERPDGGGKPRELIYASSNLRSIRHNLYRGGDEIL